MVYCNTPLAKAITTLKNLETYIFSASLSIDKHYIMCFYNHVLLLFIKDNKHLSLKIRNITIFNGQNYMYTAYMSQ